MPYGTATPASSGKTAGAAIVHGPFAFAFNTSGINNGVTFYTPTAGDILIDMWLEVTTAFNGTTPHADIGTFSGGNTSGWWGNAFKGPMTLASADADAVDPAGGILLTQNFNDLPNLASGMHLASIQTPGNFINQTRNVPVRFLTATPLQIVVSQTGAKGGAAVGGTTGAGRVYIITATPTTP